MPVMIAVLTVCLILILYVLCLRTNDTRKDAMRPFTEDYIAHRGLFDRENRPENSRSAFREAVRKGYGVELDVRLTKDEVPVVFHDGTLLRMCGVEKRYRIVPMKSFVPIRLRERESEFLPWTKL